MVQWNKLQKAISIWRPREHSLNSDKGFGLRTKLLIFVRSPKPLSEFRECSRGRQIDIAFWSLFHCTIIFYFMTVFQFLVIKIDYNVNMFIKDALGIPFDLEYIA